MFLTITTTKFNLNYEFADNMCMNEDCEFFMRHQARVVTYIHSN